MKRPEIKIAIPDNLKVQLVDDWEAITKNQQVGRPSWCQRCDVNLLTGCLSSGTARAATKSSERRRDPRRMAHLPAE